MPTISKFLIKRSSGNTAPTDLKSGEIAYTWGAATETNGGQRFFIGAGDEYPTGPGGALEAEFVHQVGGKYFTDLLDHIRGQVKPDSALIVDNDKKLDQLRVDRVTLDGNNVGIFHEYTSGGHLNVDAQGTQNLNLGTLASGSVVNIGNATSETTVQDNFTVNGDLAIYGTSLFSGDLALSGEVDITGDLDVDNINLNSNAITSTTGVLSIDPTGANALQLGTSNSGGVISIGHATSETTVNDNLTVTGDLIVNGTQTTLNVATITVDDKNLELSAVDTPTDGIADGGGITLKGTTDKTILWQNADNRWHFNQGIDIDSGDLIVDGTTTLNSDLDFNSSNIDVSTQATDINIKDNSATALTISEGTTNYAVFHTTNSGEKIQFLKDIDIDSNVEVSGTLTVEGLSTLNGGTLTFGDADTDNVVFGADINSNFIPNTDNTFDLGTATKEWRNVYIDGTAHIDTLDIDENAVIAGTLGITGATTLSSTLGVTGVSTLNDQLNVNAPVEIAGASSFIHLPDSTEIYIGTSNDLSFYHDATDSYITNKTGSLKIATETSGVPVSIGHTLSETTINDNLTVSGNATVTGNLTVEGLSTLNGGTLTLGDAATDNVVFGADVNSNIIPNTDGSYDLGTVTQEWRDLYLDGTAHIDTLDVDINATIAGTLEVTDSTTLSDTLDVAGVTTLDDTLDVAGNTGIDGDFDINTNKFNVAASSGDTDIAGTLDVVGATGIDGDFDINTTKFTIAAATGNTDTAGTLDVTGDTTLDSDLSVAGNAAVTGTLDVTGIVTTTTHIDMPDGANIKLGTSDDLQLYHNGTDSYITNSEGTLKVGTETSGGPISIGHTISETTINDNLNVTGNTDITGNATITGNTDITGNLDVTGNLTVEGLSTLNGGTLTLGDAATDNVVFGADVNSNIIPNTDGAYDLGSASQEWKDLYVDGTAHIDDLDVDVNATIAGTLDVTGVISPTTHIDMPDGANIKLGTGDDLELYHDGTNSYITNSEGALKIATETSGGAVSIGNATSETTINDNLTVAGDVTVDGATLDVNADVEINGDSTIDGAVDITGDLDVDNLNLNGNTIISTDTNGHINITPDGSGTVIVESAILNTDVGGTAVLDDDTFATATSTTLATAESIKTYVDTQITAEDLDLTTDSGTIAIDLDSETLSIVGGEGMNTSATGNIVTVEGEDASITNKGVASFQSTHFDVTAGAVNIQADAIDDTLIDWGTGTNQVSTDEVPEGSTNIWYTDERVDDRVSNLVVDGEGITTTYNDSAGTFTIDAEDATDSNKGVASFASTDFTVTTGAVGIKALGVSNAQLAGSIDNAKLSNSTIVLGSDTINLGDTITDLNGVTSLDVDNLTLDGNTISSTDTDGDILLDPDGTGSVDVNSARIINLADPTQTTDAVTKQYVDAVKSGLDIKDSVRMATTADLSGTYANGTLGVGATLTNNGTQAAFTVDGVAASLNDRVLVKDQTAQTENGIYTVTTVGSGAANWVLTRATDADGDPSQELDGGTFVFVEEGTIGKDNGYTFTHNGVPTIGTTNLPVSQFSGAGQVIAGEALTKSGNTLDVAVDNSSIEVSADTLQVKALGVTNSMLTGSIANAKLTNSSVTINSNSLSLGSTLTLDTDDFAEGTNLFYTDERVDDRIDSLVQDGEGITTTYNDSANTFTIAAEDATDSNKGIASFANTDFDVTTGAVSIKSGGVSNTQLDNNSVTLQGYTLALGGTLSLNSDDIAQGTTNIYASNEAIDDEVGNNLFQSGEGINHIYDDANGTLTVSGEDASLTNKGIAKFNTADFSVAAGDVTIKSLGVSNAQLAGSIDLTTKVTGTLPMTEGGTGVTSLTANGILYGNSGTDIQATAAGTDGYFLYSNSGTPDWTNVIDGGTY